MLRIGSTPIIIETFMICMESENIRTILHEVVVAGLTGMTAITYETPDRTESLTQEEIDFITNLNDAVKIEWSDKFKWYLISWN